MLTNKARVAVQSKHTILNYKAVLTKLALLHIYFPNGCLNRKRIYSKFCITHNIDSSLILLTLKEELHNLKFYAKLQPVQHWNIMCIGWLYCYVAKADCFSLQNYFLKRIKSKLNNA